MTRVNESATFLKNLNKKIPPAYKVADAYDPLLIWTQLVSRTKAELIQRELTITQKDLDSYKQRFPWLQLHDVDKEWVSS